MGKVTVDSKKQNVMEYVSTCTYYIYRLDTCLDSLIVSLIDLSFVAKFTAAQSIIPSADLCLAWYSTVW